MLLVDDHPIIRRGLSLLIEGEPSLEVCGEAESLSGAVTALRKHNPDLMILDLSLGQSSGVDLLRIARTDFPSTVVVVLSMHDESSFAEEVMRLGAKAYVMKAQPPKDLLEAIYKVLSGGLWVSPKIGSNMIQAFLSGTQGGSPLRDLTERETQIFNLIGSGLTSVEIANQLVVSKRTVNAHRENIKTKLGLANSSQLMKKACEHKRLFEA